MSGKSILPLGIYLPGHATRTYTTSMLLSGVNEHKWVPFSSPENVLTSQVTLRMINMDLLHTTGIDLLRSGEQRVPAKVGIQQSHLKQGLCCLPLVITILKDL